MGTTLLTKFPQSEVIALNEPTIAQSVLFSDLTDRFLIATFDQPHASSDGCGPQILHPALSFRAWAGTNSILSGNGWADDTGSMPRRRPSLWSTVRQLLGDLVTFVRLGLTSHVRLTAENLFGRGGGSENRAFRQPGTPLIVPIVALRRPSPVSLECCLMGLPGTVGGCPP
jgi:hypothetical protein